MSFDQYQRYKTVEILVDCLKRKQGLAQVSILEVGSNGQSNLEEVLPLEKIQYSCLEIPEERKGDARYIQLDGTDMYQVADGAYDVVVALDVFEHVPEEKRSAFLKEMHRVSSRLAILCFPFSNGINERAEKRANSYYKAVYGKDHIWLAEHIENGLPRLEDVERVLKKEEIAYSCFTHGEIRLWEEWMKALFGAYDVPGADGYLRELETYYADEIYSHDAGVHNYRAFLLMSGNRSLPADLSAAAGHWMMSGEEEDPVREHLLRGLQDLKQLCKRRACHQVKSFLYLDRGSGWIEEEKLESAAYADAEDRLHLSCEFRLDPEVQRLRFDPIEGCCCMISGIRIDSDQGPLPFQASGGWEWGGCYVFPDPDPQLLIRKGEQPLQWIRIEADLLLYQEKQALGMGMMHHLLLEQIRKTEAAVSEKDRIEEVCRRTEKQRDSLAVELGETARVRDGLAEERDGLAVKLGEVAGIRDRLSVELGEAARIRDGLAEERDRLAVELGEAARVRDGLAEEKEGLLRERGDLQAERDQLRQQLAETSARAELYENAYQQMLGSASWKMTAPFRKVFGK